MNKINSLAVIAASMLINPINTFAEEIQGTGIEVFFESSHISGSGTRVNIQRTPVKIDGNIIYVDMVFEVGVKNGEVVFDKISSLDVSGTVHQASNFNPGTYKDGSGNEYTLSGPASTVENREVWTLVSKKQNFSLNWTTGSLKGHPAINGTSSLSSEEAEGLSAGLSYGSVAGDAYSGTDFSQYWDSGDLIGTQQVGDSLAITLFSVSGNISESITLIK
ncbi:MAG: hypothetical protein GQ582_03480 [Methyloprofundus sp.]|nr:hypothetical protein [Methyloprofundus sp.]